MALDKSVIETFPIANGEDGKENLRFEWKRKSPNQFVILRESEQNAKHFDNFFELIKLYLGKELPKIEFKTQGLSTQFEFKKFPVLDVDKAKDVLRVIKEIADFVGSSVSNGKKLDSEEIYQKMKKPTTPYWRQLVTKPSNDDKDLGGR